MSKLVLSLTISYLQWYIHSFLLYVSYFLCVQSLSRFLSLSLSMYMSLPLSSSLSFFSLPPLLFILSISLSLFLSVSLSFSCSFSFLSLSHALYCLLHSLILFLSLSLSFSLSLSVFFTMTFSLSITHTHTHERCQYLKMWANETQKIKPGATEKTGATESGDETHAPIGPRADLTYGAPSFARFPFSQLHFSQLN
jgi:hypothetical protein